MSVLGVRMLANSREAVPLPTDDVVEIPLLLPDWQVQALEALAHERGLTAGEMVRRLLGEFLARKSQR
jgi:hypothetical protein